jgi:DNA-binding NtrC family response regulator
VDDEERIRALYRRWLVRAGYDVVEAASGSEAIQALLAETRGIKLVVTDRNMPSGTGEELIRAVRATWPAMPIVVVTGFGDDLRTTIPVLAKPVNGPTFLAAVERAIAAG